MSQLTLSAVPGFFDLSDAVLAGGNPLTDDAILKISHNAKFAAVRTEVIYMGFFQSGDTVPTPISLVDGYAYARAECLYLGTLASSRSPAAGFQSGQRSFPVLTNNDPGQGTLVIVPYQLDINDATGVVTCQTYWSASGAENQGVVKVHCIAVRSSVNAAS
jgi:hypothetical protein